MKGSTGLVLKEVPKKETDYSQNHNILERGVRWPVTL